MTVKDIIDMLSAYDDDAQVRIAWFSYDNYYWPTDNFSLRFYSDECEDEQWNIIKSKDVVMDLGDFSF